MRISDWSSDVCSSDLRPCGGAYRQGPAPAANATHRPGWQVQAARAPSDDPCGSTDRMRPALSNSPAHLPQRRGSTRDQCWLDRKSFEKGKRVAVALNHGGRRIIKTKKHKQVIP